MNGTTPDRHSQTRLKAISAAAAVLLAEALLAGALFAVADGKLRDALTRDIAGDETSDLFVVRDFSNMMAHIRRLESSAAAGVLAFSTGLSGLLFVLLRRKRAILCALKKALRESEKRYILLAEQSRTYDWAIDAKGRFISVSHVVRGVLGFRPDELVGKRHFYDLHPAEHRQAFINETFRIISRKEPFLDLHNQVVSKDGRLVWMSTNGIPLLDAQGNLLGYRGSNTLITDHKLKNPERHENECRRRVLTASARAVFATPDTAGTIPQHSSGHTFSGN